MIYCNISTPYQPAFEPSCQVAVEFLSAVVKTVTASVVEDDLLRFAGTLVDVARASVGKYLIGGAVRELERLWAEFADRSGSSRLAAEGGDRDHVVAHRTCRNHYRAAKRVSDKHDLSFALALQVLYCEQHIKHAIRQTTRTTVT